MTTTPWDRASSGLRSLLDDLAGQQPPQLAEKCMQFQMNLDLFVSDELDGVDVRLRHPHMWHHLQVCADCRAAHDGLLDLLVAEGEGRLAEPPPRRAHSGASLPSWLVKLAPAPGNAQPALLFLFAPSYLRQSLKPAAGANRSAGGAGEAAAVRESAQDYYPSSRLADRLLLSYLGDAPDREVVVQLYARSDRSDPTSLHLSLVAVGEPQPLAAELTWAGRAWAVVTLGPDGDAVWGSVPVDVLSDDASPSEAFSLRLSF